LPEREVPSASQARSGTRCFKLVKPLSTSPRDFLGGHLVKQEKDMALLRADSVDLKRFEFSCFSPQAVHSLFFFDRHLIG